MGIEDIVGKELPQINTKILIEAEAFYKIGMDAFDNMENALKRDGELVEKVSIFPAIVNTALASELYLKSYLQNARGHNLMELFNEQDESLRRVVKETIISNKAEYTEEIFDQHLNNISKAFVDWRYYYEPDKSGMSINIEFLKLFAYALHIFVLMYKDNIGSKENDIIEN